MEYDLPLGKNQITYFAVTWVELEATVLRETSQTKKDKYYTFSLLRGHKKCAYMDVEWTDRQ